MKNPTICKIIGGKRYDTTTAKPLCSDEHGYAGDFSAYRETLYRKRTGEFFLAGIGGPMTRWGEPAPGGGTTVGSGILPLSDDMARAWVEDHCNDLYETIFGPAPE